MNNNQEVYLSNNMNIENMETIENVENNNCDKNGKMNSSLEDIIKHNDEQLMKSIYKNEDNSGINTVINSSESNLEDIQENENENETSDIYKNDDKDNNINNINNDNKLNSEEKEVNEQKWIEIEETSFFWNSLKTNFKSIFLSKSEKDNEKEEEVEEKKKRRYN